MDVPQAQPATTIDPKLLARVVKGDHQAFAQLYDQSSSLLYSLAFRILGTREEAAELLQEVYLEVWQKVVRYDVGRGTPIAWLITLTRSRAIDHLRARGPRPKRPITTPLDGPPADQSQDQKPSLSGTSSAQDVPGLVSGAIAALPPAQLQAIELAYYEGLPHIEIAERLNQPAGAVKTRIKLGMSKLRESLQPCWEQGDRP